MKVHQRPFFVWISYIFVAKAWRFTQASCDLTLRVTFCGEGPQEDVGEILSKCEITSCHVGRIKFILQSSPKMNFKGKNSQTMYAVFLKVWCLGWRKLKRPPTQLQFSLAVVFKILAAFEQNQYSILTCLQSLFSSMFIMSINEWWVCILNYIMYTILYDHAIIFHGAVCKFGMVPSVQRRA